MLARYRKAAVTALFLWAACTPCAAFDLEPASGEARRVRSSESPRFIARPDDFDGRHAAADEGQPPRLAALDAFRKIVYDKAVRAGIGQGGARFQNASGPDFGFRAGFPAAGRVPSHRNFTESLRSLDQAGPVRGGAKGKCIGDRGANAAKALCSQPGPYEPGPGHAMETPPGLPDPRARGNTGSVRAQASFHLMLPSTDDASIARVAEQWAALGRDFAANFARRVLGGPVVGHGRLVEGVELSTAPAPGMDRLRHARPTAYQFVQHEAMPQSQQVELRNKKNEVLQLQHRVGKQKAQSLRLLILLLVVLAGSVGYWAIKIKRVQGSLRRMAQTDALTGLCNRHHFSRQSLQVLGRAAKAGEDVALVVFDLDHFKSVNGRLGHDAGDAILKEVAEHCRTQCRRVDHLGRVGGDEFAILLPDCDLHGARRVAEDCRVRIAGIAAQASDSGFLVTASFGVATSSLSGYDLTKLLSHADKALYCSKREGRNRVAVFDRDAQALTQPQVAAGGNGGAGASRTGLPGDVANDGVSGRLMS